MTKRTIAIAAAASLVLLAGCEIKRDDDQAEATPSPSPTPMPTASETATLDGEPTPQETAPVSIIRPDVSPKPVADIPPEPLSATIPFGEGGYELDKTAVTLLQSLIKSEQVKEGWPITLWGHTDSEGDDRGNLFASRKRAEAVAGWLVDHGIAEKRIEVIAMGEQNPVAPNANLDGTPNETGRSKNRRVEVWVGPKGTHPGEEKPNGEKASSDDGA
jgi:OOP family OmpA-OmpF porin